MAWQEHKIFFTLILKVEEDPLCGRSYWIQKSLNAYLIQYNSLRIAALINKIFVAKTKSPRAKVSIARERAKYFVLKIGVVRVLTYLMQIQTCLSIEFKLNNIQTVFKKKLINSIESQNNSLSKNFVTEKKLVLSESIRPKIENDKKRVDTGFNLQNTQQLKNLIKLTIIKEKAADVSSTIFLRINGLVMEKKKLPIKARKVKVKRINENKVKSNPKKCANYDVCKRKGNKSDCEKGKHYVTRNCPYILNDKERDELKIGSAIKSSVGDILNEQKSLKEPKNESLMHIIKKKFENQKFSMLLKKMSFLQTIITNEK
ncbi:hypothetical protein BpHYR1_025536 [Brachionus plicatilis]|uniref:Uncharacterized protein n=1 Tax=Brachionus plicatilis TaxID=10195 RepID=A0A3M7SM30_BRAPC|nr:hypothetical protein BpHYR1_025536 [Brachionus plicatilis]